MLVIVALIGIYVAKTIWKTKGLEGGEALGEDALWQAFARAREALVAGGFEDVFFGCRGRQDCQMDGFFLPLCLFELRFERSNPSRRLVEHPIVLGRGEIEEGLDGDLVGGVEGGRSASPQPVGPSGEIEASSESPNPA